MPNLHDAPVDLPSLRIFLAVAEELHFGRASEQLHLTQPYVSRVIRRLESDLGAALFDRTTRCVQLTVAGAALVPAARSTLSTIEHARADIRAIARGRKGTVRVSFAGPSSNAAIGQLARAVREQHRDIDFVLQPGEFGPAVYERILDGSVDLAIARFRDRPADVALRAIAEEHYVVAVPDTHPLAERTTISIAELKSEPFVTLPAHPGSAVRNALIAWCHDAGFTPRVVQTAPDTWTLTALVAAGVGVNFTLDRAMRHVATDGVKVLRLEEDVQPSFAYLAWREDSTNLALHTVLAIARDLFPTIGAGELR